MKTENKRQLAGGIGRDRRGAESHDRKQAGSSINHSILSASTVCLGPDWRHCYSSLPGPPLRREGFWFIRWQGMHILYSLYSINIYCMGRNSNMSSINKNKIERKVYRAVLLMFAHAKITPLFKFNLVIQPFKVFLLTKLDYTRPAWRNYTSWTRFKDIFFTTFCVCTYSMYDIL
jgi:hypothetical protein